MHENRGKRGFKRFNSNNQVKLSLIIKTMENQLKGLSVDQLKAKIYDSLVVVENHNQFIKMLNQELASRVNQEPKVAVDLSKLDEEIKDENNKED
jgi:ribosomal protein L15